VEIAIGAAGLVLVPCLALVLLFIILAAGDRALGRLHLGQLWHFLHFLLKNLRRNPLRTSLTYLALFALVAVVIVVWSALYALDHFVQHKAKDIKIIVTDKWQANSQMPFAYARPLSEGGAGPAQTNAARPEDAMTLQFYVGTLDPDKKTRESEIFFFAIEPRKVMLLDRAFDDAPQESEQQRGTKLEKARQFLAAVDEMEKNKKGAILGVGILKRIHKQVRDRIKVSGIDYQDLDLEFEIVGAFPNGRYNENAIMNRDYLNDSLDVYPRNHGGQKHPLADRSLNMVLMQVPDMNTFSRIAEQIDSSGQFQNPAVKCQTLAAWAVSQLDGYGDIIWGMQWLLSPILLVTLALVIANGSSISVSQRQKEIAVLKVLGYRPRHILALVLGESMLIGALSGFLSAVFVYQAVNRLVDNADSFLPVYVPEIAFYWGPLVGALTGLAGSLVPACTACKLQASAVFSRAT
jgi:putative ABC transport system permease protein